MGRLNNIIKFTVINTNIIFCVIGLCLFGFALYLISANLGNLDPSFFFGSGIIIALFGILLSLISCMGCQGVNNQLSKYGYVTGRRILGFYEFVLLIAFGAELYLLSLTLSALSGFKDVSSQLDHHPNSNPPYRYLETFMSEKFNNFFFGASSNCQATLYFWFWDWVNGNCPNTVSQMKCQGCFDYSVTECYADEQTCFSGISDGPACPYTLCRKQLLDYFINRVGSFSTFVLVFSIFQFFLLFLVLMLFCYHPKDSLEQILLKSGTLSQQTNKKTGRPESGVTTSSFHYSVIPQEIRAQL